MNARQLHLPFPHLAIPDEHVTCLQVANAGTYPDKRCRFYPFKARFLKEHALPEGFDLQTIQLKCWCGDGIYRGIDGDLPSDRWETCMKCSGTRIYQTKHIVLQRWNLQGTIFHTPTDLCYRQIKPIHSRISGLITHDAPPSDIAKTAFHRLLWHYDREEWLNQLERPIRQWLRYRQFKLEARWRGLWRRALDALFQTPADDIPF